MSNAKDKSKALFLCLNENLTQRGFLMPRRNKAKREQQSHVATIFDSNFKHKCYGCAFAGKDFACTTSDGQCLKEKLKSGDRANAPAK